MNREKEQAEQKLCRRYCRELRRALACVPELRERTLAQLTESIEEYLDEHPTADYQELVRAFGTPAQAAENVLAIVLTGLLIACAVLWFAHGLFFWLQELIHPSYYVIGPAIETSGSLPPTMAK